MKRPSTIAALRTTLLFSTALCLSVAFVYQDALALPQGGNVVAGSATISQPTGTQLNVNQSTNRAVINWGSFNIGAGEGTTFYQPSSSSITLNRINNGSPTQILGNLTANGQVAIINGSGVIFGSGSQINVSSLIATTNNITNTNFMNGVMKFDQAGNANASVINQGTISAAQGGLVALVAPNVRNDGYINAKLGTVGLGAGNGFTVDFYGDGLVNFAVTGPANQASVTNTGRIAAQGGNVILTADAAAGMLSNAVNNSGIIDATAVGTDTGGDIVLFSEGDGAVVNSGTLDVSGKSAGQAAGTVQMYGNEVTLASGALVDATGAVKGGKVYVGGKIQDPNAKYATKTTFANGSLINVSATQAGGSGGHVEVLSKGADAVTTYAGGVLGNGIGSGSGGSLEIDAYTPDNAPAGHMAHLAFLDTGTADLSVKKNAGNSLYSSMDAIQSPTGTNGTITLDPLEWTIWNGAGDDSHINAASIQTILNTGTNFVSQSDLKFTVSAPVTWTGSGNLTLITGGDMFVNANLVSQGGGAITLAATHSLTMNNSSITTKTGDINLFVGDMTMHGSSITAAQALLNVNNTGIFISDAANTLNVGSTSAAQLVLHQNVGGNAQNAIDAIGTTGSGGSEVILGSGIYGPVTISDSNFILLGNGIGNTTVAAQASNNTAIKVNSANHVVISDLTADGSNIAGSTGVMFNNALNSTVQNSVIRNAASGVALNSSSGSQIIYDRFNNISGYAVNSIASSSSLIGGDTVDAGSNGININGGTVNILGNTIVGTTGKAVALTNVASGSTVASNTINFSGNNAIDITNGTGANVVFNNITNTSAGNGINISGGSNNVVQNNTVANAAGAGINAAGSTNLTVANNITFNGVNGIKVSGGSNNAVNNNYIYYASGTGVAIDSVSGMQVKNNGIASTTGNSMTLTNNGNLIADGNTMAGGQNGIVVSSGFSNTVSNNLIFSLAGDGIDVAGSTNAQVNNNTIANAGGAGINVSGNSAGTVVKANTIWGGTAGIVSTTANGSIDGNTLYYTNGDGIIVSGDTVSVTGNTVAANTGKGIVLSNTNHALVDNNTLNFTGDDGIRTSNSPNATISNNNIIHPGGQGNGIVIGVNSSHQRILVNRMTQIAGVPIAVDSSNTDIVQQGNTIY